MRKIISICVLSLMCVFTDGQGVQALEECPKGKLSLSNCIRISLANSDEIKIAEERRIYAREEINEHRAAYWPSIAFVTKAVYETEDDYSYPSSINASWHIFDGGSRTFAVRGATENDMASKWHRNLIRQEVIYQTACAYVQVARCMTNYLLAEEVLPEEEKRLEIVKAKSAKGFVPMIDVVSVEAEIRQAQIALSKGFSELRRSGFVLNHTLGISVDESSEIEEIDYVQWDKLIDKYKSIEACVERAFFDRLDYRIAMCELKAEEANLRVVCAETMPMITLEVGYCTGIRSWEESEDFNAELALSIPLFEGGLRKAQFEKAKSQVNSARFQVEWLKKAIYEQAADAHEGLRNLQEELHLQEEKISLLSKKLEAEKNLYEVGVSDIERFNNARQDYVSHRSKLSNLRHDILLRFLLLLKQIGKIETIIKDIQLTNP